MALTNRSGIFHYEFWHKGKKFTGSTSTGDRLKAEILQAEAKLAVGKDDRPRRETAEPGIYFLLSPSTGLMKIGCSGNMTERFRQYETSNPERLRIIAKIPILEYKKAEKEIHEFLKKFRVNGEWFRITARHAEAAIAFWATGHPAFEKIKRIPGQLERFEPAVLANEAEGSEAIA